MSQIRITKQRQTASVRRRGQVERVADDLRAGSGAGMSL